MAFIQSWNDAPAGMVWYDEIAAQIHGTPIGTHFSSIGCDCSHDTPRRIDPASRVQYECISIRDSMTNLRTFDVSDGWGPDLLRCPDCDVDERGMPTDGYGGALVELDIDHSGVSYVPDVTDLTVIDHSPVEAGRDPPPVPMSVHMTAVQMQDYGSLRRSRLVDNVAEFRDAGANELADVIERGL